MVEGINEVNNSKYKTTPSASGQQSNEDISIFSNNSSNMPNIVESLKQQDEKMSNAAQKPVFQMTNEEKTFNEKLNTEQKSRENYQKEVQAKEETEKARQRTIERQQDLINKYGIDVRGKSAEQIEDAIRDARSAAYR